MIAKITNDSKGREICGRCGKILELFEKTDRHCSQCSAELLTDDEFNFRQRAFAYLVKADNRPKSMKYACTNCGKLCYMTHTQAASEEFYNYCPYCGREIADVLHAVESLDDL